MISSIVLSDEEAAEVRTILRRHLAPDVRVFVFGSRANGGRVKPWSDLDLVLEAKGPLSWSVLADLAEDFDESDLPWKVDLIDCAAISPQFRRIVDGTKLPLDWSSPPD